MASAEPTLSPPPSTRHPLVDKILGGNAPDTIRLSAARGVLPLAVQDLAYAQVRLLGDALPEVAEAARDSLSKLTPESILALLTDSSCDGLLIDHFARPGELTGEALEAAIAHPGIPDSTLEALSAIGDDETLTLIVTNEVRIIRNPSLLEVLRANPNLSADNRRRLGELERDFVGKATMRVNAPAPAAVPETLPPGMTPEEAAAAAEGAVGGEAPAEGEEGEPLPGPMTAEEERNYEEALKKTPVFQKIMQMNVAERVQLAMKGSAEERAILIRDTAKMVSLQVLKSPKLSEQEVSKFANMRNVTEDILRVIASHRDWTKTYTVAHALVRNPKTPAGLSVQFLPRLGTRDLKIIVGDKNIPEMLRRQARNLFLVRTQPPKKRGKKAH